jgi:hypothetical protein
MKKERNILLIGQKLKLWASQLNIKDLILNWIERISGRLHNWAWDKRWKKRDSDEWIKGYREFKKKKCPHN